VVERKRFDGTLFKVAECLVGDSQGCVKFRAVNGKYAPVILLQNKSTSLRRVAQ
jgi:hypothetical protein